MSQWTSEEKVATAALSYRLRASRHLAAAFIALLASTSVAFANSFEVGRQLCAAAFLELMRNVEAGDRDRIPPAYRSADAKLIVALQRERRVCDIVEHYKDKAEAGDIGARINLGYLHYNRHCGLTRSDAMAWYESAGEHPEALFGRAHILYLGEERERQKEAILDLLLTAETLGSSRASIILGFFYLDAMLGDRDVTQATAQFRKAHLAGNPTGTYFLSLVHYRFSDELEEPVDRPLERARELALQALQDGEPSAAADLARMVGEAGNHEEAAYFAHLARGLGSWGAEGAVMEAETRLTEEQKAAAEARAIRTLERDFQGFCLRGDLSLLQPPYNEPMLLLISLLHWFPSSLWDE